jgi:hypothetical protein
MGRGRSRGSGGGQFGCRAFLSTPLLYLFVVVWESRSGGKRDEEGRKTKSFGERRKKEEMIAIYMRREVPDIGASRKRRRTVTTEDKRIGFM